MSASEGGIRKDVDAEAADALYFQAVRVAKEFGWPVPARGEFETQYKAELAASRKESE
jgi:hypothetical protein